MSERSSWVAFATEDATNEDGREERPAEQLIPNSRKRRAQSPRHARDPARLASRKEPKGRNISRAGDQGAKRRNTPDQARRRGIKGDPRRASIPTPARSGCRPGHRRCGSPQWLHHTMPRPFRWCWRGSWRGIYGWILAWILERVLAWIWEDLGVDLDQSSKSC
jgi:hypothetical protein